MSSVSAPGAIPKVAFPSVSLYVGDLSPDVTETQLFEIFSTVGPVASIRVCRDAITRRSLGYAYVNFHNAADAERAIDSMNFVTISGRSCRIMWSQRDPALRKSGVGNIFVKHLDRSIDHKSLYDTFSPFGNILSCKVAMDSNGVSLGYGFVHYQTAEAAEKAITNVNGMIMLGQQVQVAHFKPRAQREGATARFTNLYIKYLPTDFDKKSLEELFGEIGQITSSMLAYDKEGHFRGFAFVNYETHEAAVAAINRFNDFQFRDAKLFVGRAMTKAERVAYLLAIYEQRREERIKMFENRNLYVKHIGDATDETLRSQFEKFGAITSAKVMVEDGRSKNFGFVCFENADDAARARRELHGKILFDKKPIYVDYAQRKEVRAARSQIGAPIYSGGPMGFYGYQMPNPRPWGGPARQVVRNVPYVPREPRNMQPRNSRGGRGGRASRGGRDIGGPANYGSQPVLASPVAHTILLQQLNAATPQEAKQLIGEKLFPLIRDLDHKRAGKITGMLLEMDNGDLLELLDSKDALRQKVQEAIHVLETHTVARQ